MAAPRKKGPRRVSAPLVSVVLDGKVVHLYKGDVLPEGASKESVEHLDSLGYLTSDELESPENDDPNPA